VTLRRPGRAVLLGIAVLAIGVLAGSAMGLFSGTRPADLGFAQGRFAPGDWRPNWVSSTVPANDEHFVAPIAFAGEAARAWSTLETVLVSMPGATVAMRGPAYLHVEFASRVFGFVDDAQFALDAGAGVIHVKSAARLGIRDFSVNRDRVESIRAALSQSLR
jgi:uncharacterized protein (DUF1499 family)